MNCLSCKKEPSTKECSKCGGGRFYLADVKEPELDEMVFKFYHSNSNLTFEQFLREENKWQLSDVKF